MILLAIGSFTAIIIPNNGACLTKGPQDIFISNERIRLRVQSDEGKEAQDFD
ncbi:hypothetical protein ACJX0J_040243, partial [Zea mays]